MSEHQLVLPPGVFRRFLRFSLGSYWLATAVASIRVMCFASVDYELDAAIWLQVESVSIVSWSAIERAYEGLYGELMEG